MVISDGLGNPRVPNALHFAVFYRAQRFALAAGGRDETKL